MAANLGDSFVFDTIGTPGLWAWLIARFHCLGAVLVFVGLKMLAVDFFKVPVAWSLGTVGAILAASILASLAIPPRGQKNA